MENVVVEGESSKPFSPFAVSEKIKESSGPFSLLLSSWQSFARHLSIDEIEITKLKKKINNESIELDDVIFQVILEWQKQFKKKATLKALYDALKKCKNLALAEDLEAYWANINVQSNEDFDNRLEVDGDTIDFLKNTKPLTVTVKRPTRKMIIEEDSYKLPVNDKGHVLIINIMEFEKEKKRVGSEKDVNYMETLCRQLGYKNITVHNPGKVNETDLINYIADFKKNFSPDETGKSSSSCIVYIGSHGLRDEIVASDGKSVHIYDKIIYQFNSHSCPGLEGKPKLFLFQACQEFATRILPDKVLSPPMDHTLVCHSTFPGYTSNRDPYLGSWFTYCVTKVIMENAHRHHLHDLLKLTQSAMKTIDAQFTKGSALKGQFCTIEDLGMEKLYFNMYP